MASVNKVILLGNAGADPDIHKTQDGGTIANLSIATSKTWKDKETGEKKEKTEWHRVVFFRRLAEIVEQWVTKGQKLFIVGELQTRKWQDEAGNDKYTTEIVANEMQMLSGKSEGGERQATSEEYAKQSDGDSGKPLDDIPF